MVLMKKVGGNNDGNLAYAVYRCSKNHTVQVFSGFRGIIFSNWKSAPTSMDLCCFDCIAGANKE